MSTYNPESSFNWGKRSSDVFDSEDFRFEATLTRTELLWAFIKWQLGNEEFNNRVALDPFLAQNALPAEVSARLCQQARHLIECLETELNLTARSD